MRGAVFSYVSMNSPEGDSVQVLVGHFIGNTIGNSYGIRIRIFIIPINGPTIGANKLHILIIVIGGNYTYIYINTMFLTM